MVGVRVRVRIRLRVRARVSAHAAVDVGLVGDRVRVRDHVRGLTVREHPRTYYRT